MQKIVLDTNILVSAILSKKGRPAKVLDMVLDKEIQVYFSQLIINEYIDVLFRPKFKFDREYIWMIIDAIRDMGIFVDPTPTVNKMLDEDDRIFYDTAKESGAILITGNMKHYPKESFILTAAEFLEKLNKDV